MLNHNLRRTQTMIEGTRAAMNEILGEWVNEMSDFRSVD
jgi:hypothetical protein